MEDFTPAQMDLFYGKGRLTCLFCGGTKFLEGPHGGMAVNILCDGCGARYNVAEPESGIRWGQVIDGPTKKYAPPPKPPKKPWWWKLIFWGESG